MIRSKRGLVLESVLEIIFGLAIILITIPIWSEFQDKGYEEVVEKYEDYGQVVFYDNN